MPSPLGSALFSLALAQLALAQNPASNGNSTTTTTINRPTAFGNLSFTPEPRGRGTVGLIISCTVTFWFCVWTAVHPDIIVDATPLSRLVYKATWMLVSITVPEGIIMCAISQLNQARRINKAWREKFGNNCDYLDLDGAFFVVMGGFVIDWHDGSKPPEKCGTPPWACWCPATRPSRFWIESQKHDYTATLTPTGFLKYLNEGRIDRTSFVKTEIVDKSNANWMSKIISGFHAIWLIVVCSGRRVAHLPLSLVLSPFPKVLVLSLTDLLSQLEIHVLIQVFCTIFIFGCWYYKPLDINRPIKIKLVPLVGRCNIQPFQPDPNDPNRVIEIPKGREPPGLDCDFIVKRCPPNSIAIIAKACYDIAVHIDANRPTTDGVSTADDTKSGIFRFIAHLARVQPMLIEVLIVGGTGLLHCVAWNSHFPTMLEKWLWRISSVGMCLFPLVTILIVSWKCTMYQELLIKECWQAQLGRYCIPGFLISQGKEDWELAKARGRGSLLKGLAHLFLFEFCHVLLLAYLLCVVYITAGSYASMRDPPAGTMITPVWSNYLPHVQ